MIQVLKYELPEEPGAHEVKMRPQAHVLSVGLDPRGRLCLWARVPDDYASLADDVRTVYVAYTGHSDVRDACNLATRFIGTVVNTQTGIVWHVWVK